MKPIGVGVRVGVDVGGTFTKAVACSPLDGAVVARAITPTTHGSPLGVAEGVVRVVREVFDQTSGLDAGPVLLVAHSTTQAVNALLEGDTAVVGVLGIGRRPELRRSGRRTQIGDVRLAPGRALRTIHHLLDATDGLTSAVLRQAVERLIDRGAQALCVSEAFGVEDPAGELLGLEVAAGLGLPATAGHELSGLYGLESRTVTAALNASILPTALAMAKIVERSVGNRSGVPLLVMRGDGGAAEMATMRRRPLLTAFSGPAASVAGALRHLALRDGVVVEVGGTSTNVSTVRSARPVLSYVRVLGHVTFVRSLDVRVVGVAGGSLPRIGRALGRPRVVDTGPRSAHIAGLPYAAFVRPADLSGARARLVAPRPGDPEEYAVVETPDGRRYAPTVTCAANALGHVPPGVHARGDAEAARLAFDALGRMLRLPWERVADDVLRIAAQKVCEVVAEALDEQSMTRAEVVGLGGGAGSLVPAVADLLGLPWSIPPDAEVISSIGDALSLVRSEVERAMPRPSAAAVEAVVQEAEEAAVAAGAAPATLQVETEAIPERGALRAVAVGAAALDAEARPGSAASDEVMDTAARTALGPSARAVSRGRFYTMYAAGPDDRGAFAVVDRHASVAAEGRGQVVAGTGPAVLAELRELIPRQARRLGPLAVAPAVRLVRGARLTDLSVFTSIDGLIEALASECERAGDETLVALVSRT